MSSVYNKHVKTFAKPREWISRPYDIEHISLNKCPNNKTCYRISGRLSRSNIVTNSILQATGNVFIPVINIFMGGLAKVIINYVLVSNPAININGAPIGTTVCYFIYMFLNLIYIRKITGADIGLGFWAKPLGAGIVMAAVAYFAYGFLTGILGEGYIFTIISFVISGGLSVIAYLITLISLGGITKDDIKLLPKGDRIINVFVKAKLMKRED